MNNLLLVTDSGDSAIIMLLDLTAAFDTIDHIILISRLEHVVGIKGIALEWFRSYLSDNFSVRLADLQCGVPQGSITQPMLFYILPLGSILNVWYFVLKCLKDIKAWMVLNFSHFNESKTEIMIFCPNNTHKATYIDLGSLLPYAKPTVKNLGVIMDIDFKQIKFLSVKAFIQSQVFFLSFNDLKRVIHVFISSKFETSLFK